LPDNDRYTLLAGWLLDGSGEPAWKRVAIEVRNGAVSRIAPLENGAQPREVLDFSADTVLPCLVDSHVHLFMSGNGDPEVRTRQLEAGFSEVLPKIEARIRRHMGSGVMALRDGGDGRGHTLRFRQTVAQEKFPGFVIRAAGKAWRGSGRYGKLIGRSPEAGKTLAEAIDAAAAVEKPDHIKIVNSGLNSLLRFGKTTPPQFSREELQAAVCAAEARGLKVMVHANGQAAVKSAVEAGCHSIEHGFFMGTDNLLKMADRRVVWVPTAVTMKAYAEALAPESREAQGAKKNLDHQLDQLRKAKEAGVVVAVGSDAGSLCVHHGSGCLEEIRLLMDAGYSCTEAVRCATVHGARLLGVEHVGRQLAPGRPASFLVCPGGPEQLPGSLYRVKAVYVQGKRLEIGEP